MARKAASNPKKKETQPKKVVAKTKKIVKKTTTKVAPKPISNPKKFINKILDADQTPARKFFALNEDAKILEATKKIDGKENLAHLTLNLAKTIGHSREAIRDRVKRYLSKISAVDQKMIITESKKFPNYYVFYNKNSDGTRKIEKISALPPALSNREFKRKHPPAQKTGSKKITKKKSKKNPVNKRKTPEDIFEAHNWLWKKMSNKDSSFALDYSVHLLLDIFNALIESGVSKAHIEKFVKEVETSMTLEEIFHALVK